MVSFEISYFIPEIISIATTEGTVKIFLNEWTTSGITDTRISMLPVHCPYEKRAIVGYT